MKVVFFVMTSKGHAFLDEYLKRSSNTSLLVVSARDSALESDFFDQIEALCGQHGIPFCERTNKPDYDSADLLIAVSWRWMIDQSQMPLIVIHDSLLPRLRGFNPLVTALINGDQIIGATALYASEKFDEGPIIYQSSQQVNYPITISDAIILIENIYRTIANFLLNYISQGNFPSATPQNENEATYSLWRDERDYFVDWGLSSEQIKRHIDAVGSPYKGAMSYMNGCLVKLVEATVIDDKSIENRCSGKVLFVQDGMPVVVCGSGLIVVQKIYDLQGNSMLPLSKYRTRFSNSFP